MCGRFFLASSPDSIADVFGASAPDYEPRWNVAPTEEILCMRVMTGNRSMDKLRWGLIPQWVKDTRSGSRMINARSETAASKPSFRSAMKRRRCLIPADGFYEWKKEGGTKRAFCIAHRDRLPLAMAGIWEVWTGPERQIVETCCILTTQANAMMSSLHDRMPVLLTTDSFDCWPDHDHSSSEAIDQLCCPYGHNDLEAWEVSTRVNRPTNEGPDLVVPVR